MLLLKKEVKPFQAKPQHTDHLIYFVWFNTQEPAHIVPAKTHEYKQQTLGLRSSSICARHLRPALACPTAHVSHATGQIHNSIIIYRL